MGLRVRNKTKCQLEAEQAYLLDFALAPVGVEALEKAELVVVVDQRGGLLVVGIQASANDRNVVVLAAGEGLAGDVVDHGDLGRPVGLVVHTAGGDVDEATADAPGQNVLGALEEKHGVQLLADAGEHGLEALGLALGAGETVEDEAAAALEGVDLALHQLQDNVVGDEGALVHVLLGLETHGVAVPHCGAQNVTSGQVAVAVGVTKSERGSTLRKA
ncbi:trehalose-phosphatase [Babesia caballi]|uniref:Trehalose-phosphatase n=1 Tax=Babesia caballi TaxID=5871 RepID=A0AAV4LZ56_BABCB|nr:trehalose-phosphatase [Babesia caballi]